MLNELKFMRQLVNIKRLYEENNLEMPKHLLISYKTFDELQKELLKCGGRVFTYDFNRNYLAETLDDGRERSFTAYTLQGIVGEFNFIPTRSIPDGHTAVLHPI